MRLRGAAIVLSILGLLGAGSIGVGFAATHLSGAQAPDFVLKSFNGENLRLSEYRGEVVMLSFWASWCSDCRAQLADMNGIYRALNEEGLQSLTVSMDSSIHDTSDMIADLSLTYPVLNDADLEVSRLYDVESLPIVMLIDREGTVREVIPGLRQGKRATVFATHCRIVGALAVLRAETVERI